MMLSDVCRVQLARWMMRIGLARPAWLKTAAARFRCRPGRGHIVAAARLQLVFVSCAYVTVYLCLVQSHPAGYRVYQTAHRRPSTSFRMTSFLVLSVATAPSCFTSSWLPTCSLLSPLSVMTTSCLPVNEYVKASSVFTAMSIGQSAHSGTLTWIITRLTMPIGCCVFAWSQRSGLISNIAWVMTFKKPKCTVQCQCDYNISIRVLQEYIKNQHPGNFTTSDLYYNRFSQLGKPSMYHTPQHPQLQFYDVIFSLVIIRLLGHCSGRSFFSTFEPALHRDLRLRINVERSICDILLCTQSHTCEQP